MLRGVPRGLLPLVKTRICRNYLGWVEAHGAVTHRTSRNMRVMGYAALHPSYALIWLAT